MQAESTLPKLLLRNARIFADRDAMREKEYGIWYTYTWRDYAEEVRRFALGLAAIGFQRGDKLTVIGENRPRLYFAMLAAQCLGGISLAAYQDSIAKEMGFVLSHAETRFIVAENEEQVDKLFEIRDQIPTVERVIYDDPRGLELKDDPWLIHFPKVQELGDDFAAKNPGYFEAEVAKGEAGDVAILSYTSGTTGEPKAAILTYENLLASYATFPKAEGWNEKDEMVAYL
ncbi:MAG: AMP-binding protein, partial [SAR324 cluster bacterium]|nr:AMP-binding protein [SAR324 cluster bacterium]